MSLFPKFLIWSFRYSSNSSGQIWNLGWCHYFQNFTFDPIGILAPLVVKSWNLEDIFSPDSTKGFIATLVAKSGTLNDIIIRQIFKLESNQTVVSEYIKTGLCPTFQILTRLSHNVNDRMLESQFKCQTVKCQTAKCLPNILMNLQKLIYT